MICGPCTMAMGGASLHYERSASLDIHSCLWMHQFLLTVLEHQIKISQRLEDAFFLQGPKIPLHSPGQLRKQNQCCGGLQANAMWENCSSQQILLAHLVGAFCCTRNFVSFLPFFILKMPNFQAYNKDTSLNNQNSRAYSCYMVWSIHPKETFNNSTLANTI